MKNYKKILKQILTYILISFTIYLVTTIILLLSGLSTEIKLTIVTVLTLIILILLMLLKNKFDAALYAHRHVSLFNNMNPAVDVSNNFMTLPWLNSLQDKGFISFKKLGGFEVHYLIDNGARNSKKHRVLNVAVIIKDESIKFEDQSIVKVINDLESSLHKKAYYNQRMIYQIKSGDKFTQEKAQSTNLVMFMNQRGSNLVLINIYHFREENIIFFVNSDLYPPTSYYKFAAANISKYFIN